MADDNIQEFPEEEKDLRAKSSQRPKPPRAEAAKMIHFMTGAMFPSTQKPHTHGSKDSTVKHEPSDGQNDKDESEGLD